MSEQTINTGDKHLTFTLDGELFALDIETVREVQDMTTVTRIPHAPPHLRGVVNLRGNAVPVFDLRRKLGLAPAETTINTRIMIMEIPVGEGSLQIGAMADSVKEVVEIEPQTLAQPPRIGSKVPAEFIRGVIKRGGRFIMLLDGQRIFGEQDAAAARHVGGGES
ncbi:MAG: purine-binding chemotaxis protein CheW [Desulfovibrionales bacterium]|jgi:purine-binding chemotaxis protein CheW|nr:purine-binding chemotaxis protein CheW [Desulfovibrionales bacterium]